MFTNNNIVRLTFTDCDVTNLCTVANTTATKGEFIYAITILKG